jgi:hypothetical protein
MQDENTTPVNPTPVAEPVVVPATEGTVEAPAAPASAPTPEVAA